MNTIPAPLGEMKKIKRQLKFIYSIRFIASSLDSLSNNLVEVNGIVCKWCRSKANLCTSMRTMSLMEHVESAEVQAIGVGD